MHRPFPDERLGTTGRQAREHELVVCQSGAAPAAVRRWRSKTEIREPIMIVCTGRSGSTVFYRMLALHRDVGWLSTYNQVFPSQTWLSTFSLLYEWQILARVRNAFFFPKPYSPYTFWGRYLPGITRHDRPLYPEDVPEESIEPLRRKIAKVLRYQRKSRFLMKVTGWARMAYFDRLFGDTIFIYLKRNPLDVVASWIKEDRLNVTTELDSEKWEWGAVPERYRALSLELGGGPHLSAAVKTQLDLDDIRENIARFPGRCFELGYEQLWSIRSRACGRLPSSVD